MAAIDYIAARDVAIRSLVKRKNWAARNPGVVVVFAVVFIVAVGLIGVWTSRKISKRRAAKSTV